MRLRTCHLFDLQFHLCNANVYIVHCPSIIAHSLYDLQAMLSMPFKLLSANSTFIEHICMYWSTLDIFDSHRMLNVQWPSFYWTIVYAFQINGLKLECAVCIHFLYVFDAIKDEIQSPSMSTYLFSIAFGRWIHCTWKWHTKIENLIGNCCRWTCYINVYNVCVELEVHSILATNAECPYILDGYTTILDFILKNWYQNRRNGRNGRNGVAHNALIANHAHTGARSLFSALSSILNSYGIDGCMQ